jgi:hypothetical protein
LTFGETTIGGLSKGAWADAPGIANAEDAAVVHEHHAVGDPSGEDCPTETFFAAPKTERARQFLSKILVH